MSDDMTRIDLSFPIRSAGPQVKSRRLAPPPLTLDCALFLDIDGTLLEIAATPDSVEVDAAIATQLQTLARVLGGAVALVTGRAIRDADKLFAGPRLPIAGQHGCERRSADGSLHEHAPQPVGIEPLRAALGELAARHQGLMLEDKGATLALHYRLAPRLSAHVHRTVRAHVLQAVAAGGAWSLQRGKGLVEVRPEGIDKGTAIVDYMGEPPFRGRTPVFIGDDVTDELGFAAIEQLGGWAVKVGPGRTRASYRLADVSAVRVWLAGISQESR